MRRLCALLLLTLSAWFLVAPIAAADSEQNLLPACCRRHGIHHCAANAHAMADRQHTSFRSTGCMLMPHNWLALVERLAGLASSVGFIFLACWFPFISTSALTGYARALALKIPRGPPCLAIA